MVQLLNDYEQGQSQITKLGWDDRARKLTHEGAAAWTKPDSNIVEIVSR